MSTIVCAPSVPFVAIGDRIQFSEHFDYVPAGTICTVQYTDKDGYFVQLSNGRQIILSNIYDHLGGLYVGISWYDAGSLLQR